MTGIHQVQGQQKAQMSIREKVLLSFTVLVSLTSFVILVLLLSFGIHRSLFDCEDKCAYLNDRPSVFCCRQSQSSHKDSEKQAGAVEDNSRTEAKISHKVSVYLENSPQLDRLTGIVEETGLKDRVNKLQLRLSIAGKIVCGDTNLNVSEFIRFDRKSADLDDPAKEQIKTFMNKSGQMEKLYLFGFTSPDGEKSTNDKLADNRIDSVRKYTTRFYAGGVSDYSIGETHRINGIADSRSVIIVACRKEPSAPEAAQEKSKQVQGNHN